MATQGEGEDVPAADEDDLPDLSDAELSSAASIVLQLAYLAPDAPRIAKARKQLHR
jgi:hypothetical protein